MAVRDTLMNACARRYEYFKNHQLEVVEEGEKIQAYYLQHPDHKRIEGCMILFTPEGVVITGDYCPGGRHAVGSGIPYDAYWFGGERDSFYVASRFLEKRWVAEHAGEELRDEVTAEDAQDYWSREKIVELKKIADDVLARPSGWSAEEFAEALYDAGYEIEDEIPGWNYDTNQFSLLASIQRRFAELWKERKQQLKATETSTA